ncbi:MAG: hypothetical protein ABIG10_03495 [bacterium]
MKAVINWLMLILFFPVLIYANTGSDQDIFNGLFFEIGPAYVGYCYPYNPEIFNREIVARLGYKGTHKFSGTNNDLESSLIFNTALGYKLSDFCFTVGFYYCSLYDEEYREVIDTYSYYWEDPNKSCRNVGEDSGCELALLWLDPFFFFFTGIEYNIWKDFSLKLQAGISRLTLKQGRETWLTMDEGAERTIYQENTYSGLALLSWSTGWGWLNPREKTIPARLLLEGGWGYTKGELTDGRNFHFALKVNIALWNIE